MTDIKRPLAESVECQTIVTVKKLKELDERYHKLISELMKNIVKRSGLNYKSFEGNDEVSHYTGLSSSNLLLTLLNFLKKYLKMEASLPPFQQLISTFEVFTVWYRFGLFFGVHPSTVCHILMIP